MKCRVWIVTGLVISVMTGLVMGQTPPTSHDDSFSKEGLFKANVADLKDTELVAHPDVPLDPTKNVLWCGTLQLAWNKAIDLVGEKLHFEKQPSIVDLLNQEDFTDVDLDPASYVAIADFERNNVEDEIRAALEQTFHGGASPELIPPKPKNPLPHDFVAYAYLYKNLAFPLPFEENDRTLIFSGQRLQNFGFRENKEKLPPEVFSQVSIYDYKSYDDFIITLKTKSQADQLILAKITPGITLQATITDVLHRMAKSKPEIAKKRDQLAVPKLNFDIRGEFSELTGLLLEPSPNAHVKNLTIGEAKQFIRFQLNEKGAIVKSEAVIIMTGSAAPLNPPLVHQMIFDKPFLILMKQINAKTPYLAFWIGNSSLLIPADKTQSD